MSDLYSGVEATGTPGMAGELGTAGERMTALAEGAPEISGVPGESGVSPNVTQNPRESVWRPWKRTLVLSGCSAWHLV